MEGLKKIGRFFMYWLAVLGVVPLIVVGAGAAAREYYKKYVEPSKLGN